MLVEDDKSLREIYGVRLLAEGYDIVSAGDGEEALAVAIKERPSLIITDVMMPKISGFDMLDILRSTTETKNIRVIMMTALSSDDNKDRGERLGADRYLVKSQVGIEDVVRVVHEVLEDGSAAPAAPAITAPTPPMTAPAAQPPVPPRTPVPLAPASPPPALQPSAPSMPAPAAPSVSSQPAPAQAAPAAPARPLPPPRAPISTPAQTQQAARPQPGLQPHPAVPPTSRSAPSASDSPSRRARVIQPIPGLAPKVDIQALVDKEIAKETSYDPNAAPATEASTTTQERDVMQQQLNDFVNAPAPQPAPAQAAPAAPVTASLPPFDPSAATAPEPQEAPTTEPQKPQIGFPTNQPPAAPPQA